MRTTSILFIAALLSASVAEARMYKWVDENGMTHYGDAIPMKYRKKEHKVMNDGGITVKDRAALPTEAELAAERRQQKIRDEEEKVLKAQRQRDRVLLSTYTTERDLVVARDARIEAVDSQIQLSNSIIEDATRKLKTTETRITQLKAQNRTVPADLYAKKEREENSLKTHERVAAGHIKKRGKVSEQFDGYIVRFRELKAEQQKRRDERDARRRASEATGY